MSQDHSAFKKRFERLVEDYLRDIEDDTQKGRLLPADDVVDQLGRCRPHNYRHRDDALLGQARLARHHGDHRWLDTAARTARAINMWCMEWIYDHLDSGGMRRGDAGRRPEPRHRDSRVSAPRHREESASSVPTPTKSEEESLLQDPQVFVEHPAMEVSEPATAPAPVTAPRPVSSRPTAHPREESPQPPGSKSAPAVRPKDRPSRPREQDCRDSSSYREKRTHRRDARDLGTNHSLYGQAVCTCFW